MAATQYEDDNYPVGIFQQIRSGKQYHCYQQLLIASNITDGVADADLFKYLPRRITRRKEQDNCALTHADSILDTHLGRIGPGTVGFR
jgi:hypothetical protein